MGSLKVLLFIVLGIIALHLDIYAQKNDTLVLIDNTRHIGEINSLNYGKLSFVTKYLGTADVTWSNVNRLMSPKNLTIKELNGTTHHGVLLDSERDYTVRILIEEDSSTIDIPMNKVVYIAPVKRNKWLRIYGYLDAGFSYTKSSDVRQYNLGGQIGYRADDYDFMVEVNSINTFQGDIDRTTIKQDITLSATRYLPKKFIVPFYAAFEENSELGIDLRTILGLGIGNEVLQRQRHRISITAMPIFNNEQYTQTNENASEQSQDQTSVEAAFALNWRAFNFSLPELDFNLTASYFRNVNEGNRDRFNLNASLSYEIIDDFFITITFYDNFDSRPPSNTASTNDWGTTTKLRYSFKQGQRAKRKKKKEKILESN